MRIITDEELGAVLEYIQNCPTGNVPVRVTVQLLTILNNLPVLVSEPTLVSEATKEQLNAEENPEA